MSFILFYSNYCNNSSQIIQKLANSQVKNDIHFISIDNRIKKPDGSTYIIAENFLNNAEFAGVNFAPDGKTLFVNIYSPTMTIAITGPWEELV